MRLAIVMAIVVLAGCTQPEKSKKLLEAQGYTEVRTGGYNWFACSDDDTYSTSFTAMSPNGTPVKGAVCAGFMFKGATIRFE